MTTSDEEKQPLTLGDAQHAVDASIQALGGYWPPLAALARLFEECGELARAVNQTYGPKPVKPGESPPRSMRNWATYSILRWRWLTTLASTRQKRWKARWPARATRHTAGGCGDVVVCNRRPYR